MGTPAADRMDSLVGTTWVDSNQHTFTVEVVTPNPDSGDRAGDTIAAGTSSNCPGSPPCNRNHDGPYSVFAFLDELLQGRIFGWSRTLPEPAPPVPIPALAIEATIATPGEAVALGHRMGAGTYCAACERTWDDPAAHRTTILVVNGISVRQHLARNIWAWEDGHWDDGTLDEWGDLTADDRSPYEHLADAIFASGWTPRRKSVEKN